MPLRQCNKEGDKRKRTKYSRVGQSVALLYVRGTLLTTRGLLRVVPYMGTAITVSSDVQEAILAEHLPPQ
jgi:hypothetical protein